MHKEHALNKRVTGASIIVQSEYIVHVWVRVVREGFLEEAGIKQGLDGWQGRRW